MSVLVEYFVAPDDAGAALTIDLLGGPGTRYPSIDAPGIEPFIRLAMLEELLTGRTWEDQQADPSSRPTVAERDRGERLVVRIDDAFVAAMADTTDEQLTRLARPWAEMEEFYGQLPPALLVAFAQRFRAIAQQAQSSTGGVFCWVCT